MFVGTQEMSPFPGLSSVKRECLRFSQRELAALRRAAAVVREAEKKLRAYLGVDEDDDFPEGYAIYYDLARASGGLEELLEQHEGPGGIRL